MGNCGLAAVGSAALNANADFREEDQDDDSPSEGEVAHGLVEEVGVALSHLMGTRFGDRFEDLDPIPETATLAILGEPVDDRPGWRNLAAVLTGMVLNELGHHAIGTC